MSIYRCNICDEDRDADFHGCNESPYNKDECMCDACEERIPEQDLIKFGII